VAHDTGARKWITGPSALANEVHEPEFPGAAARKSGPPLGEPKENAAAPPRQLPEYGSVPAAPEPGPSGLEVAPARIAPAEPDAITPSPVVNPTDKDTTIQEAPVEPARAKITNVTEPARVRITNVTEPVRVRITNVSEPPPAKINSISVVPANE
jgi:hypothetical protein